MLYFHFCICLLLVNIMGVSSLRKGVGWCRRRVVIEHMWLFRHVQLGYPGWSEIWSQWKVCEMLWPWDHRCVQVCVVTLFCRKPSAFPTSINLGWRLWLGPMKCQMSFSVVLGMRPWGSCYHICWTSWKCARNPSLGKLIGPGKPALASQRWTGLEGLDSIKNIDFLLLKLSSCLMLLYR